MQATSQIGQPGHIEKPCCPGLSSERLFLVEGTRVSARLTSVSVLLQASIAIASVCKDAGDQIVPSPVTVRMGARAPPRMEPVSVHLAIEDPCAREVSPMKLGAFLARFHLLLPA